MTVASDPGHVPVAAGRGDTHGRLARLAVLGSAVFGTASVTSIAAVVLVYAFGAESAVEDTVLGAFLATVAITGLLGSFASFLAAIVAKVRHERWALLWLPLGVFPALLAFLVLGEAFWWE